ncbi:MAG TPA: DUF3052 family protein [Chloroflexota bacterium]|nr:DUF3052 family protein [Chloroflexota bacterium]
MGLEAVCTARFQGRAAEGKALLETDALLFRGELRLAIPLKSITSATSTDGELAVTYPDGTAVFELGEKAADKWANTILHPKGRVDKLGIKAGMRVALVNMDDGELRSEVAARDAEVLDDGDDLDVIFLGARSRGDLEPLTSLSQRLKPAGAIWVVSPRGDPAITERHVMDAARAAELVDVKVVRFSDTHTSAKLVIPVAQRKKAKA